MERMVWACECREGEVWMKDLEYTCETMRLRWECGFEGREENVQGTLGRC